VTKLDGGAHAHPQDDQPFGEVKLLSRRVSLGLRQDNLAMMIRRLPGWKVEAIGDDIAG